MRLKTLMPLVTAIIMLTMVLAPVLPQPAAAQDERLSVIATYSVLGDVVMQVAGDAADVDVLMPLGADPHSYSASGSDILLLEEADAVFVNGAGFEESLLELFESDSINAVIASNCVFIWEFGAGEHDHGDEDHGDDDHGDEDHGDDDHGDEDHGDEDHGDEDHGDEDMMEVAQDTEGEDMSAMATLCEAHHAELAAAIGGELPAYFSETMGPLYTLDQCGEGHGHEHGDEDHEEGEEHGDDEHGDEDHGHEHGEGSCDPHVWMDPHNGILWALMARDTLSELDPANADVYAANAEAYIAELAGVAGELFAAIDAIPQENRVLISNHDSFGYLANPAGFELVEAVIPGGATTAEPSAQDLVELAEIVEDEGVPAVFSENTVSNDLAARIADATGAELVQLFTGSLSEADGPAATYIDFLRFNYTNISTALSAE